MKNIARLIEVAIGRQKADLVLKDGFVVNVFTGEILKRDVAVADGYIAGVGNYSGEEEIDCTGKYICPGFIDAHIHIESTMVLPDEFVRTALVSGTTTVIADPHEIVNVCGAKGMQFMLDVSEDLPCNIYFMLPSCVPATGFETAGANFTAEDMKEFIDNKRVLGLGEVMCFPDVIAARGDIMDKLRSFEGRMIDGHAPNVLGKELEAYVAAGVRTDHECTEFDEAFEKVRAGQTVQVREGSAAHNLASMVQGILDNKLSCERFMFCTDDKHLEDIMRDGHIRWNVKLAVELGMPACDAIRMASWNAAREYGLTDVGAVAAGYKADLVVLNSLKGIEVYAVYKDGRPAQECLDEMKRKNIDSEDILNSVKAPKVNAEDIKFEVSGKAHVIEMVPFQLITNHLVCEVPSRNGVFVPNEEFTKLCVVERHGKNGNITVCPLKGYGIKGGAIATTVAHDSHNIIAAGDNDDDIVLAISSLAEMGGGYILVREGKIAGKVPLSVAGLMSLLPAQQLQTMVADISTQASGMGIPYYIDPFTSLSFMALPVIPSLRLTDMGLFDVDKFEMIENA